VTYIRVFYRIAFCVFHVYYWDKNKTQEGFISMKKILPMFLFFAILITVTACGNKPEDVNVYLTTEYISEEHTTVEESTTAAVTSEPLSSEQNDAVTKNTSSTTDNNTVKQAEKESNTRTTHSNTQPAVTTTGQTSTPATTVTTTSPVVTTTTATAPATTTPAATVPAQTAFDVSVYVQYAISYGKSIGLTYNSDVRESWDNPIDAGLSISDESLKSSIRSRLNRYKNAEGFEYFNVWAEPGKNSEYRIIIAYA
jgi:hypothetical protein